MAAYAYEAESRRKRRMRGVAKFGAAVLVVGALYIFSRGSEQSGVYDPGPPVAALAPPGECKIGAGRVAA